MAATSSPSSYLTRYLQKHQAGEINPAAVSFYASLDQVMRVSPAVGEAIVKELADQRGSLKLIASENYSSLATQAAMGNLLTDKYAEGIAGHRFYAGCDNVDVIEAEATRLARELFGAEHAYVQPHSGADANLVAFLAILNARVQTPAVAALGQKDVSKLSRDEWEKIRASLRGQKLMGLDYYSGGHLTHGYRHNVSAQMFDVHPYAVDRATGLLDLDQVWRQAKEVRPLVLLAGYSAYPRAINFAKMRQIADDVGAVFMVDMAHFAGLVAGKVFTGDFDPVAHAHVVTSTTHKTLRGPRGGLVLSKKEFAEAIDKGCPTVLGGPLPHVMAAKAVAFTEASSPDFRTYAAKIVENARALAEGCVAEGMAVATGGTDNHLLLVDVQKSFGLTGRQAESAVRAVGITLNRNSLPFDANGPWYTSGLRLGTPALTTRGLGTAEMREIAAIMKRVLQATTAGKGDDGLPSKARFVTEPAAAEAARRDVAAMLGRFPLYPELMI